MKILRLFFVGLIALATLPASGQSIQSEMITSSTCSLTGSTGTVITLTSPSVSGTNFIFSAADILITSSNAVVKAPVVTFISGTNTALEYTGTGTQVNATNGYFTHYALSGAQPALTATNLSLYIATTGSFGVSGTCSVQIETKVYPALYP